MLLGTSLLLLYLAGIPLPGRAELRTQPGPPPHPGKTTPACLTLHFCSVAADEMCFSAGTRGLVSKKDGTGIRCHCHHRARARGVWQGQPAPTAARLAEPSSSGIRDRCRSWHAKASRPPCGWHRGSGPRQGRTKDHRVRRLGEILKQVLNKASPAAAITLCNKPGKERTLPPSWGSAGSSCRHSPEVAQTRHPALRGRASLEPRGTSRGKPGADLPARLAALQPQNNVG